ncbi:GNAT family N-acetyltransferase [Henriciella sp.]|uniref:GNAT family N-acetyltransferase n=1 Tax=Henriciella sp. TaxID=1968823 RepID=UPI00262B6510|nr:GNAT family N-acetyltransferase [Henriciella sp.]
MSDLPFTKTRVSAQKETEIRQKVRSAGPPPSTGARTRLATPSDADAFLAFLLHPDVHGWIYSLPKPLTLASVQTFIDSKIATREAGEGLLFLTLDEAGEISGYSDIQVWPQWGAGEIAGAIRPDRQNRGQGGAGMTATFTWMFEALGLELICNTTALDNIRIQSLFRKTGLEYKGDIESLRPDGSTRTSQVWEVEREAWLSRFGTQA